MAYNIREVRLTFTVKKVLGKAAPVLLFFILYTRDIRLDFCFILLGGNIVQHISDFLAVRVHPESALIRTKERNTKRIIKMKLGRRKALIIPA